MIFATWKSFLAPFLPWLWLPTKMIFAPWKENRFWHRFYQKSPWKWFSHPKTVFGTVSTMALVSWQNKVSPRTQKQHLFLAVGMVEIDRRIRLAAVRHVLERYICRYESNPFNLTFLNISEHNEACLRQTLKHASYTTSAHPRLPPFSPGSSPSATPSTSISWIFQPTTKHVSD